MGMKEEEKTVLAPHLAKALCYVPFIGCAAAVAMLLIEKDRGIKWHAIQSLMTYVVFIALYWVGLPFMSATGVLRPMATFIGGLAGLGFLVGWLFLAVKSHEGENYRLPVLSQVTDKFMARNSI